MFHWQSPIGMDPANTQEQTGWYALCLSSQEIFGRGLASYLIKKDTLPSHDDIRITFTLQNMLGLAGMATVFASAGPLARWYGQDEIRILLMAAAIACYGYACRGVPFALMERNFEYSKVAVIEILENILFYAIAVPLVWIGRIETGLVAAIVLRSWGATLAALVLRPVQPAFRVVFSGVASIVDFGFSVTAGSLLNIAVFSVPAIFVGKLSGMKELGQAQMAFSLYGNLLFVTAAVVRLNLNTYARLAEHTAVLADSVNQHLRVLAASLVPVIVLFAGLSPLWALFLFGQKWPGLPALLLTQAPGYLLAAVFWGVLNPALLVSGGHRHILFWLAGFVIFYAALAWLLSPAWGALGVAVAFSVTEIFFHPLLFWIYGINRLVLGKIFLEIGIGAGFMAMLWFCAHRNSWWVMIGAIFYLLVWYARNRKILMLAWQDFAFTASG